MKRLLAIAIGWLGLTAQTVPPPATPLANPQGRTPISLGGQWRVIVDPLDTGQ